MQLFSVHRSGNPEVSFYSPPLSGVQSFFRGKRPEIGVEKRTRRMGGEGTSEEEEKINAHAIFPSLPRLLWPVASSVDTADDR